MNTGKHDATALRLDQLSLEFARLRLARPELIKSMEQSLAKFGQLSPLIVRQGKTSFAIIDGFKRYHAATALGWAGLEANLFQVSRRAATAMILTYNRNNHSLSDYEEALVLLSLKQEHQLSQDQIAALVGYSSSWVSRRLSLVDKLEPTVKDELKLGVISTTQARELAQLPRGNQPEMIKTIIDHDLTTRQTVVLVDELRKTQDREQQRYILDHPLEVLERDQSTTDSIYDARLSSPFLFTTPAINHSHDHALKNLQLRGDLISIQFHPQILKKNRFFVVLLLSSSRMRRVMRSMGGLRVARSGIRNLTVSKNS